MEAKCIGRMYGPLAYLGFISSYRGICTRKAVMEKLVGPGGSANTGGQITTIQEEHGHGKVQGQGQVQISGI